MSAEYPEDEVKYPRLKPHDDPYGLIQPDRLLASTPWERKLCRAGIPQIFWQPSSKLIKFKSVPFRDGALSPTAQRQWIKALITEPPRIGPFVVVTSSPTDCGALYLAHLMRHYGTKHPQADESPPLLEDGTPAPPPPPRTAAVIDLASGCPERMDYFPNVILLHNLLSDATAARVQLARDLLLRFWGAFRILVLTANDDPYSWARNRLGKTPTVVFRVDDIEGVAP